MHELSMPKRVVKNKNISYSAAFRNVGNRDMNYMNSVSGTPGAYFEDTLYELTFCMD